MEQDRDELTLSCISEVQAEGLDHFLAPYTSITQSVLGHRLDNQVRPPAIVSIMVVMAFTACYPSITFVGEKVFKQSINLFPSSFFPHRTL